MFLQNNKAGQVPFVNKKVRAVNRCGATVALGDVLALDLEARDAATAAGTGLSGASVGVDAARFQNAVAVAATNRNGIIGVVTSLLSGGGADDTEVELTIYGLVDAKIGGTDWSGTNDDLVVRLMAETGSNRRLVAFAIGANNTSQGVLATAGTNLSGSNAVTTVLFNGLAFMQAGAAS